MDLAHAMVAQVFIPVRNLDDAIEFYRYTLGLTYLYTAQPGQAFFQCGSVQLVVGVLPDSALSSPGYTIVFRVPDIHTAYSELFDRGVNFQNEPHISHRTLEMDLWQVEFADPDGNQLALMSEVSAA